MCLACMCSWAIRCHLGSSPNDPMNSMNEQQGLRTGSRWWCKPSSQWPPHTRLSLAQYRAQLPPCWDFFPDHHMKWATCDQCRAYFRESRVGLPSGWICRCGLNDMGWCHEEPPHEDTMCRECFDLMTSEGIDVDAWGNQVRDYLAMQMRAVRGGS